MFSELKDRNHVYLGQVPSQASPFIIAQLFKQLQENLLVLCLNDRSASFYRDSLACYLPDSEIIYFPAWDCQPYDRVSPKKITIGERLDSLARLAQKKTNKPIILLTTINAIVSKVLNKDDIENNSLTISLKQKIKQTDLINFLVENGYQASGTVTDIGEFLVKGSIIDVYPLACDNPVRIDFFADEIDVLKEFDPITQLTLNKISSLSIIPAGEVVLNKQTIAKFNSNIKASFSYEVTKTPFFEAVNSAIYYPALEQLMPLFVDNLSCLTDYLTDFRFIFEHNFQQSLVERHSEINDYYQARKNYAEINKNIEFPVLAPDQLYLMEDDMQEIVNYHKKIQFSIFTEADGINLDFTSLPDFHKEARLKKLTATELFIHYAHSLLKENDQSKIIISVNNKFALEKFKTLFLDYDIELAEINNLDEVTTNKQLYLTQLNLSKGFKFNDLIFVAQSDIINSNFQQKKTRRADKLILEASSLKPDEYIVHNEHGIGQFKGLQNIKIGQSEHDFILIEYNAGDKLYVPVENIEVITRYGGNLDGAKLDKLGSLNWQERKAKLKKKIRDIAGDLVKLAGERQLRSSSSFIADQLMQEEFKLGFGYNETLDQERAIADVVADLEKGVPMDRLICGDVGFGKTEVAMRAAFTVLSDQSKGEKSQIAIVAPTTLLARQHFRNFKERFSEFGYEVGQLSRMVTASNKKKVKEKLAAGKIDIIVGTHAILAKDVKFKNLSLVIVDEEQHFGVVQKEALKKLKANVHLLTLSATPIPRTLQMSLSGIRDLSLIATAPVDRMAIRSFVMPFDDIVIREAILRECNRSGRVYFVCPRIKDIAKAYEKLIKLVPEVKMVRAHGQMSANDLDEIMTDFCDGKYQLLLSTTIIESGIDISDANTLIVYNADMFSLSALYQLRGRVGRSKVRAYAYFTVDGRKIIEGNAKSRLEIMQTLDGLGAGFTIASHDLDLRGAGNLLGEEQSGHIKEVGVELYQKMLQDELELQRSGANLTDIKVEADDSFSPNVNLGISVRIPEKYIKDMGARMDFYRRIAEADSVLEAENIAFEMQDRFGKLPESVENLFAIIEIKQKCKNLKILKLDAGEKAVVIKFLNNEFVNPTKLIDYIARNPMRSKIRPDQKVVFKYGAIGSNFLVSEVNNILAKLEGMLVD